MGIPISGSHTGGDGINTRIDTPDKGIVFDFTTGRQIILKHDLMRSIIT